VAKVTDASRRELTLILIKAAISSDRMPRSQTWTKTPIIVLRIGSTEPPPAGPGAAVMERLWRQYPRINFRVVEADSATLLSRDLPERRIELAILPLVRASVSETWRRRFSFKTIFAWWWA
jgi:DNA-binding transcriptional LysR family regulator